MPMARRNSLFTLFTAAKALHSALAKPGADYLLFRPVARQSGNLLHRM